MSYLIAIVAHNNLALTKVAVASAFSQDATEPHGVIVLDNASIDGTQPWLRSKGGISHIVAPERRSLAACWNGIMAVATIGGYDGVLMCNNDIQMLPEILRLLIAADKDFVSGVSVNTKAQAVLPEEFRLELTLHPDFSCFLLKTEAYKKVGQFDASFYPAYAEDCDYHVRMHRAGITAHGSNIPFYHYGSGTLKSATAKEQIIIRRGADENRERFKTKYGCYPGTAEYNALFAQATLL